MEGIDCIESGVWPNKVPTPYQRLKLRRCTKERPTRIARSSTVGVCHEMHAVKGTTSGSVHSGSGGASNKLGSVTVNVDAGRVEVYLVPLKIAILVRLKMGGLEMVVLVISPNVSLTAIPMLLMASIRFFGTLLFEV